MKTTFTYALSRHSIAIADLSLFNEEGAPLTYIITRINVPPSNRGQHVGSWLLREIVEEADAEGVTLVLEPIPSGGLDHDQLVAWYKRYGFSEEDDESMTRPPQPA